MKVVQHRLGGKQQDRRQKQQAERNRETALVGIGSETPHHFSVLPFYTLSASIIIQSTPLVNAVRPGTSRTAAKAGITGRSTRAFEPPNEADDAARGERPSGRADRLPRPAASFSSRIRRAAAQAKTRFRMPEASNKA